MSKAMEQISVVLLAIIGVAILAVLVGGKSKTVDVINAGGTAFVNALKAATGPAML